jgi:hypothetical protein
MMLTFSWLAVLLPTSLLIAAIEHGQNWNLWLLCLELKPQVNASANVVGEFSVILIAFWKGKVC